MKVNIALAQINTQLGDVSANLEKHLELIHQAQAAGAELIVFPELIADRLLPAGPRSHCCSSSLRR